MEMDHPDTQSAKVDTSGNTGPILVFDRFKGAIPEKQCTIIKGILKKYILGIVVSRGSGDILYSFQVEPKIRMDLISQFIAALSVFGEENVGQINRIFIGGLDIEMSILHRHGLILTVFFRPNMVQDYLEEESLRGLDLFFEKFKGPIEQNKSNRAIYEQFDEEMCHIITNYLNKLGVLKEV